MGGMKMLVFGGSGRTGQVVWRMAELAGWEVTAPAHADCDLSCAGAVGEMILRCRPDAVANCAAISGLEDCLDSPLAARLVNAAAPEAMARACRCIGARFVHLSTDYVLDGRREGLKSEEASCRPTNAYGRSKHEAELRVAAALPEALILRVSWVCGNPCKPGFPEGMVAKALSGAPLAAIDDKFSLPTDAADIARAILALLRQGAGGLFHVCSTGAPLSWHNVACLALQTAVGQGALPAMPPVSRQSLAGASFFRETRPPHTAMDNAKLVAHGIPMPAAAECIRKACLRYLRQL